AQWTANEYTVTFDAKGGTVTLATITVTYDGAYGQLPVPTRDGYTFVGWFTNASGGNKITSDTLVDTASNHTIYAQWTANEYTVTFDARGGTVTPATITVTYDGAYGQLPVPTRTGYTFAGWFTAAEDGTQVTPDTKVAIAGDHMLHARWTANTYEVTFDANSGTVDTEKTNVTYDENYDQLPDPTRTGYNFAGWFTEAEGGTQVTATTKVTIADAQTLYAQWTPAELAGTVSITGTAKFGETLIVDTTGINNTGTLYYQWKRGDQDVEGATSDSYTLGLDDIGQVITCVVNSDVQTGSLAGTTSNSILKANGPAVTGVSKTDCTTAANNDGTLVGVTGDMEYKLSGADIWMDGDGSIITGLTKGTYNVRIKETATHFAGSVSNFTIAAYSRPPSGGGGDTTPPGQTGEGGDKTPEEPPVESLASISGGTQELPVTVGTSGNTANVKPLEETELQQIIEVAGAAGKSVAIDLSSIDDMVDTAVIPGGLLTGVAQSATLGLEI
ncbi:MAG: InlB B-repeat-containing protein, partial [Bacteroidales bacterium]|nr:InlB B-repeat-containing protein [Bacteroidales bacterium]